MADVKWIKLSTGLPNNRQLNQIRTLPNGDSIALMFVYLLCVAGEVNEHGLIYLTPEVPYTDEMLATEFRMELNTVRLGLTTLQRFGLIEVVDDIISLPTWERWQNVDGLDKIREQTRKRVADYRQRKKEAAALPCNVTSNANVTDSNATDKDIEIDKDKEKDNIYSQVIEYLNLKSNSHYRASTPKTQTLIKARVNEGFVLDDFKTVIDKKCREWKGTDMDQYLRPETLFGTKFEGYLNQKEKISTKAANELDDLDDVF